METIKILLIDDIADDIITFKTLINEAFPNATLISASSVQSGIESCLTEKPNVILLNSVMPEMDGCQVCQILKKEEAAKGIPIIMLTVAETSKEIRIKALECGVDAFLAKPVDESELKLQIRAMLRIKESENREIDENERLKRFLAERTETLEKELADKIKAELAVRKAETHFRALIDKASDGVVLINAEGRFLFASSAATKMFGYTFEDISKFHPNDLTFPEDLPMVLSELDKLLHDPSYSPTLQYRFALKNGTWKWIEGTFSNMLSNPDINAIIINFRDISERKLAEKEIEESEEKYSILFKNSPDSYLIISDGIFVDCNKATELMLRGDRTQIIGNTPAALSPEFQLDGKKSSESAEEKIQYALKNGENTFEWMHRRFDGSDFYVEVSIAPMMLKGKQTLFTAWRDISVRKKTEQALQESESQFREFFEKAADAIFIAEIETGIIVDANLAASQLMQMPRDQIVGLHQSKLHPPVTKSYSNDTFVKHSESVKQQVSTLPFENKIMHSDGSLVDVEILASEVVLKGKRCLMGTFRDITERKKAEELLRESEYFFKESQRAAFVGSYKFDLQKDFWTASEVLMQIFGIDTGFDRTLQGWIEIVHPDDRDMMSRYFLEDVVANRQPFNKEYRIVSQLDDEIRWVLGLGRLNFDANGNVVEMIGTIQDISERKFAELDRSESLEFNRSLLKTIPFGMDIVDEEGTILFQSEKFKNIFGTALDGSKCWDNHRDDKKQCPHCPLHQGIEIGRTEINETSGIMGGRIFQINHTGILFKGKKAMLEIFQDITERKQAEEKLKESQQLFQELFDASPDAIVLIDPHDPGLAWKIVDCNKAACQMNGYLRDEMIGQSIDLLNLTLATPEERITYLDQLRKKEVMHVESSHRHKDGHVFPVEISTSLVTIGGQEMVLGIDRDITDRKLAEEAIRISDVRLKRAELASKSGHWEFHLDSGIMVGSEGAAKVYGFDGGSFRFDRIKKIPLPEYRPALDMALKNLLEKDIPYDIEFKISTADTHEIKDIHSVAFYDKHKRVIFGIIQDVTDRKKAEFDLVQSEERYRRFISQISEGVYRFECDEPMNLNLSVEDQIDFLYDHLFIAECNNAFLKMYGIQDEKEMIGKSHLDFHGGRNNQLNRNALRKFVTNGFRVEDAMTEEINPVTGKLVYYSNNSMGIFENNQLVRIWGTQTDITEKIRANQVQEVLFSISNAALSSIDLPELIEFISKEVGKLLDSTNFYIAFYDEKTDMLSTIYERDEKDVFETWPAQNSITGYVVKQHKSLLLKEDQVDAFYEANGIQAFGTPSKVWLGVPLESNKKAIGAIVVQSYDNVDAYSEKDQQMLEFISHQISISIERKKTEKDLRLMGKAFDQSPVTIVITDKDGNIEYVNPIFTMSTGYTLDDVKGQNPRVLNSGYHSKEYFKNLWDTILAGNDWFGEFQNKRKNGEIYWESAVISPITDEKGQIAFFLAIKEDITEKKKMIDDLIYARNKAEESDRLKSAFLANMSHEIRTPLNSIIGFSELLLDADFGTEQHEEFARTINESGNGLLAIISDIMDLSKIEAGQIQLTKRRFSAHKLINDIQKEYSFKASSKGIELRIDPDLPKEDYFIFSDDQRLKQVLINFVGNAIKFTDKGFIEIGYRLISSPTGLVSEPVELQFYVKDTGIGVPKKHHQKIFERFRQVEMSHTRKYGGNGLGLAISKSLIEMLGGEIGMISEEGIGSTFYFTVPIS